MRLHGAVRGGEGVGCVHGRRAGPQP